MSECLSKVQIQFEKLLKSGEKQSETVDLTDLCRALLRGRSGLPRLRQHLLYKGIRIPRRRLARRSHGSRELEGALVGQRRFLCRAPRRGLCPVNGLRPSSGIHRFE